jgi:predicted alpha/beta hydrolase family esterase
MKVLIVHGLGADPEMHWFQWLKDELEKEGWEVEVPEFPTPEGQSLDNWLKVIDGEVKMKIDSETVLVGHSVGATFCLDLLDIRDIDVAGLYLVSCFTGNLGLGDDFDPLNETFAERDFDWDKIASGAEEIRLFHGKDDPYVPLENALNISENLETHIHIFPKGKHLNQDSGFTEFPLLLDRLKTL